MAGATINHTQGDARSRDSRKRKDAASSDRRAVRHIIMQFVERGVALRRLPFPSRLADVQIH